MNTSTAKLPDVANFDSDVLLAMEKEVTGVYITGHPMDKYREPIEKFMTLELASLDVANGEDDAESGEAMDMNAEAGIKTVDGQVLSDGSPVVICGMIYGMKTLATKKGNLMAFVDI